MAVAGNREIPPPLDGDTHSQIHAEPPDIIDTDDADGHIRRLTDVLVRQDTQVQEEDRDLAEPEASVVAQRQEVASLTIVCQPSRRPSDACYPGGACHLHDSKPSAHQLTPSRRGGQGRLEPLSWRSISRLASHSCALHRRQLREETYVVSQNPNMPSTASSYCQTHHEYCSAKSRRRGELTMAARMHQSSLMTERRIFPRT